MLKLKDTKDVDIVVNWCNTVYDYLLSLDSGYSKIIDYFRDAIENSTKNRKRVVKELYQETNLIVRETLTLEQISSLNIILKEKFNHNIDDEIENDTANIQKIIKRGRIRNDREFELVRNREEAIYADDSQWDYAETLRKLMSDYEDMKSKMQNEDRLGS